MAGFALPPATRPSYFMLCRLAERLHSTLGDVRDAEHVRRALDEAAPEVVFHLAAQPLVRRSYREPVETFATNIIGTAHVLEAVRHTRSVRAVVVVTSDKCYDNREDGRAYREDDALGGGDPYSASKACAELVTAAYRRSFLEGRVGVATGRAGNVIGGGDWADDRLVPDAVRAFGRGERLAVRHAAAQRPWQHVLEPLAGYLMLAERLHRDGPTWSGAWNFGPAASDARPVSAVADLFVRAWGSGGWDAAVPERDGGTHEADRLVLDSTKAVERLGWRPRLTLSDAIEMTVAWYRRAGAAGAMFDFSCEQIRSYAARSQATHAR